MFYLCNIVELYACSVCKEMTVTCCKHCRSKLVQFLPSSLHREVMAEKTLLEKFILMSRIWRSGSCRRTFLCMGVKSNLALAWTSYWSRVDRDLSNHWFLSGHHNAWSDQSAAISAKKKKKIKIVTIAFYVNTIDTILHTLTIHILFNIWSS